MPASIETTVEVRTPPTNCDANHIQLKLLHRQSHAPQKETNSRESRASFGHTHRQHRPEMARHNHTHRCARKADDTFATPTQSQPNQTETEPVWHDARQGQANDWNTPTSNTTAPPTAAVKPLTRSYDRPSRKRSQIESNVLEVETGCNMIRNHPSPASLRTMIPYNIMARSHYANPDTAEHNTRPRSKSREPAPTKRRRRHPTSGTPTPTQPSPTKVIKPAIPGTLSPRHPLATHRKQTPTFQHNPLISPPKTTHTWSNTHTLDFRTAKPNITLNAPAIPNPEQQPNLSTRTPSSNPCYTSKLYPAYSETIRNRMLDNAPNRSSRDEILRDITEQHTDLTCRLHTDPTHNPNLTVEQRTQLDKDLPKMTRSYWKAWYRNYDMFLHGQDNFVETVTIMEMLCGIVELMVPMLMKNYLTNKNKFNFTKLWFASICTEAANLDAIQQTCKL